MHVGLDPCFVSCGQWKPKATHCSLALIQLWQQLCSRSCFSAGSVVTLTEHGALRKHCASFHVCHLLCHYLYSNFKTVYQHPVQVVDALILLHKSDWAMITDHVRHLLMPVYGWLTGRSFDDIISVPSQTPAELKGDFLEVSVSKGRHTVSV